MRRHLDMAQLLCFKTNQFLAFNKPAGIAVQAKEGVSFHQLANGYAHRELFSVHRIDQPASGLVLFGRSRKAATALGKMFANGEVARTYYAVVKGNPQPNSTLTHPLAKLSRSNKTVVDPTHGKPSSLTYHLRDSSDHYHLLEIQLHTGRHHQIRAQLHAEGLPIKGDQKYGARRGNRDQSIHLHAYSLEFKHFISGEDVQIVAPLPTEDPLWKYFDDRRS